MGCVMNLVAKNRRRNSILWLVPQKGQDVPRNPRKGDASERAWAVVQEATGQTERALKRTPQR